VLTSLRDKWQREGLGGDDSGEVTEEGSREDRELRVWAEMLLTCFSRTPEVFWEEEKKIKNKKREETGEEDEEDGEDDMAAAASTRDSNSTSTSLPLPALTRHHSFLLPPADPSWSSLSPLSLFPLKPSSPQQVWQQQWQWVSEQGATTGGEVSGDSLKQHVNTSLSWKDRRDQLFFQPLACLGT
jgi:hypothetical protein